MRRAVEVTGIMSSSSSLSFVSGSLWLMDLLGGREVVVDGPLILPEVRRVMRLCTLSVNKLEKYSE